MNNTGSNPKSQDMQTNIFPISLPFDAFQIQRVQYSPEQLHDLRKSHNKTHSFFRDGDFIYISPMADKQIEVGELVRIGVPENPTIVGSLIRHIFFRTFRKQFNDIVPLTFYPFRILSRKPEHDLVFDHLPQKLKNIIAYKKQIEIHFRNVMIDGVLQYAAVVSVKHRWIFTKTCLDLINDGFDIVGLSVLDSESIAGLEGVLAPIETLIGKVLDHDGQTALIEMSDGSCRYDLTRLFLERSRFNLRRYLASQIGENKTDALFSKVREEDVSKFNGKNLYDEITKIGKQISSLEYVNSDGFTFRISHSSAITPNQYQIVPPTYIFDYTPGKTHSIADVGLNQYGPYDSSTFDNKHPSVLVVCHKSNRGGFSTFLSKFRDGIPNTRYFSNGFKRKYDLHDIKFSIVELDDYSPDEYKMKITEEIRSYSDDFTLAIVETNESFKKLPPAHNPYFHVKATLMSFGIPVQFITNSNVRKRDSDLQYLCNTMGLQVYAKIGGTPWVLPANQSVDREIIIGIGSSVLKGSAFAGSEQQRIVGIATFFSGDSKYLFGSKCKDVPYDRYFQELLATLRSSIQSLSQEYGWHDGDTVRIIFHIFKPIKNIELDVVKHLIDDFTQFQIRFAFVTISDHHPFILFDLNQTGKLFNGSLKGEFVPQRGVNRILDENSCLLQIQGPQDIKTGLHRFSNPILIRCHEDSTFTDLQYITQQVYNFSMTSWRGFFPVQQPASLYYANLIAGLLSKLRRIEGWNPDVVNIQMKRKKWFL